MDPYPIRTERLLLRRPRLDDAEVAVALLQDDAIGRWIPIMPSPYRTRNWTTWVRANTKAKPIARPEGLSFPFVIEMDGRMVGMIGLRWDAGDKSANIGYWIGKPFRKRGIATEAARALTAYAFRVLGAQKVWATVLKGNKGSPNVLKACGMRLEATLREHGEHRGRRYDEEHYGVLREEWRGSR